MKKMGYRNVLKSSLVGAETK